MPSPRSDPAPAAPPAEPPSRSTAYNALLLATGTGLGHLLLVAAAPVLTRLYRPEDLGLLGLFLAYLGIVSVALSLRYDAAIPTAVSPREAALLTRGALALSAPISLFFTGVFLVLIEGSFLGYGILPPATAALMFPALFFTALFAVLRSWHVREERFRMIAGASFAQSGARALGQVVLGAAGMGWPGLLLGDLIGRISGIWRLFHAASRALADQGRGSWGVDVAGALRTYRKFPLLSVPSSVLDALAANLRIPGVAFLYGMEVAGQLALMDRVIAMPLSLVGGSMADAFHGRMASLARENPAAARRLFLRTAAGLLAVGVAPTLLLVFFGRPLFAFVFGSAWGASGEMASWLAPAALAALVVSPLSRVVFIFQGQEYKLVLDVVHLVALVAVFAACRSPLADVSDTLRWINGVEVGRYALYFLLLLRIVRRAAPGTAGGRP